MYIKRHIEEVLKRQSKRFSAVVVTGARQVGKSTMLEETLGNITKISLDTLAVQQNAEENPSLFFKQYKPPVIVDEVQKAPSIFPYVKEIADQTKQAGQFFLSGSQSFHLMKNVTESLAGRAGIIQMMGLSQREVNETGYYNAFRPTEEHFEYMQQNAPKFDFDRITENIWKGSFPRLYESETNNKDWLDFHNSYIQTYIEKDVRALTQIQNESAFIKFIRSVASLTGQQLNMSTLANVCGKDSTTIQRWLSILETSGLIYILQPYHNNFSKRLIKSPKIYFLDTGLACFLLGWNTPTQLVNGAMWGAMFETFVVAEVLKSYYNDGITRPPLYYYRDKDSNEIDLVIEEGDTLYPVEIKVTSDPNKSMVSAFKILEKIPSKKISNGALICLCSDSRYLSESIRVLPVNWI